MKLTVEMTESDVERGWVGCAMSCALALAIRRAAREAGMWPVSVDVGGTICRLKHGKEYIATMPDECPGFVDVFDTGEDVKPLDTFTLFFVPFEGKEDDYYPGEERDTRYS